jgi:hypothetical protein
MPLSAHSVVIWPRNIYEPSGVDSQEARIFTKLVLDDEAISGPFGYEV